MNARARARAWLSRSPWPMPPNMEQRATLAQSDLNQSEDHLRAVLAEWDALPVAPAHPAPIQRDQEHEAATLEKAEGYAADAYFTARPDLDAPMSRRLFAAGFARGWNAKAKDKP